MAEQGVTFTEQAAKRIANTVRTVEASGLTPQMFRRRHNSVMGTVAIPAIVTQCYRDDDGMVWVNARRQVGLPYTPQPYNCPAENPGCTVDDNDFLAIVCVDGPVVQWSSGTLFRVHMPLNPEVRWKLIPDLPIDPATVDEPPPEATTRWVNPFTTEWPIDSCIVDPLEG